MKLKSRLKPFTFILSLGILIRLLVMPFFAHQDLLSIYTKAAYAIFHQQYYLISFSIGWLTAHIIPLKIYSWFWPSISQVFKAESVSLIVNQQAIFTNPQIFRLIFLLKLPFLIIEIASLYWLLKFFKPIKSKLIALTAWAFNPYLIYTLYLHGRMEILAIFFLIGFFWFIKQQRISLASLFLGLAIALRLYPLLFVPFLLLLFPRKFFSWFKNLSLALLPLLLSFLASLPFKKSALVPLPLQKPPLFKEFILPAQISVGHGRFIYLLPATLIAIYLYAWYKQAVNRHNLWRWCYLSILVFLSFSFFHPQYFSWLAIFITFQLVSKFKSNPKLIPLLLIQFLGWLLVLLHWGNSTAFGLLTPINYYFFSSIGSPIVLFKKYLFLSMLDPVNLGRSMLLAVNFFLAWLSFSL
ncbi:hypothetical protein ACFL18_02050 [Patescibacteria group bacterium]